MEDISASSDAGDGVQNNQQDLRDSDLRVPDLNAEAQGINGGRKTCLKGNDLSCCSKGCEQTGKDKEGMNQACAVDLAMDDSSHFSKQKSEEICSAQDDKCHLRNLEEEEEMKLQCSDTCISDNLQTFTANSEDEMIGHKRKECDIVCEKMESNDLVGECDMRVMIDNETREGLEEDINFYQDGLYLDELTDDVLLHIASFLEARVVKFALSRVCERFRQIFDNEAYWKSRVLKRWPKKYPPVSAVPDFEWLDACVEREDSHRVWSDPLANTRHFMYSCNIYAEVDCVHLVKDGPLLMSGDRNRSLNVIDLSKYNHGLDGVDRKSNFKDMLVHSDCSTHKGWIWCMESVKNHLFTGSWDTHIRLFDMNSQMTPLSSYKCKSAVLSLMAEENEIVASCFDKKVYFIDRRSSEINSRSFHKQPVLSVAGNEQYLISASEDKTISIFDRRAAKIMKSITLDSYPLCVSFRENQLWFGDKGGQLHLCDATQGLFQHVGTYNVGHTDKVTGVISTLGAIFTCSGDKTIKVHTPSQDPDPIASLDVHLKQIASVHHCEGILASAGGEDSLGVWLPKHWDSNTYLL